MLTTGIDSTTTDLLHGAVHNLKGPASRLRLLAQLLRRSGAALDEDAQTLLKHIEDSAAAVDVVAEGLRNYTEICARPLQCEPVELDGLVEDAIARLRDEMANAGARVTHAALPRVRADRFLMTWLLQELLANAIRFRGEVGPRIHIGRAAGGPAGWQVAVSDNGRGIEKGLEGRVFLPFKKLCGQGAGLGLTICRKIIELHGGEIWAEPKEGGAEFRFMVGEECKIQ